MYLYLTIADQYDSKDVVFKGGAPLANRKKVAELLAIAREKGLDDGEENKKFLFDK